MTICDEEFMGITGTCMTCGSDVHGFTCNEELWKVRPESMNCDWWYSCSNQDCPNHYGEDIFQDDLEWMPQYYHTEWQEGMWGKVTGWRRPTEEDPRDFP